LWHPFANATEQPVKGTIQQWKEITASKHQESNAWVWLIVKKKTRMGMASLTFFKAQS
jgi:hypothetical protein